MFNSKIIIAVIILLFLIIINFKMYKKESFEENKKGLLVLYGESFRDGLQSDRTTGTEKGFIGQMKASDSHIKFMETIKNKYDYNMDVSISTYCTKYNKELKDKYKNFKIIFNCENELIGWNNIAMKALNNYDLSGYDFILLTRNDICFKDEFIHNFKINNEKVLFVSQQWTYHDCYKKDIPNINPTIISIPKKFFRITKDISVDGNCWDFLIENYGLTNNDMGFLLNTYHDADSYKNYNPYYYMVGREQTTKWHDKDKINPNFNTTGVIKCYNINNTYV
jgi:hypothetical protein